CQRNEISDGPERHQVKKRSQIKIRGTGKPRFPAAFDERVSEFERKAGGTEFAKLGSSVRRCVPDLWIDKCGRRWGRGRNLMMVQHNDIDATLAKPGNAVDRGRTAIGCEK